VGYFAIVKATHHPHKEECPICLECRMLKRKLITAIVFMLPLEIVGYVISTGTSQ
jgi:hypothetical protein